MLNLVLIVVVYAILWIPFVTFALLTAWIWRGRSHRSRFWTRQQNGTSLLVLFPSFTVFSLILVVAPFEVFQPFIWLIQLAGGAVGTWAMLVLLVAAFWWPAQRLWGPRWWTRQSREVMEQAAFEGKDPFQSALARVGAPNTEARKLYWLGADLRRWHGARLMDPVRPSRRDRYFGDVWVCEGGVWFDLPGASEMIQDTVSVAFPWEQILGVSRVGDNENAAGVRVSGLLDRSVLTRLVLVTTEGEFLFEIASWKAAQAAQFISEEKERINAS